MTTVTVTYYYYCMLLREYYSDKVKSRKFYL